MSNLIIHDRINHVKRKSDEDIRARDEGGTVVFGKDIESPSTVSE